MSSIDSAIRTATAGLLAQGTVLGVTADNIANLYTPGYKRGEATLTSGVSQAPTVSVRRDISQGAIAPTGNPNDLAINGNGFFQVQLPGGTVGYTRDGSFGVSAAAVLVDANGNPVVGPVSFNPANGPVSVASDGTVTQTSNGSQQVVGQIQLSTFNNPAGLGPDSGNLLAPTNASGQPILGGNGSQIVQGAIETPNVDLSQEIVTMIMAKVAYEASARLISTANNMEKRLLDVV